MNGEQRSPYVDGEYAIEMLFGDCADRSEVSDACIGEQDIDGAGFSGDGLSERVQIAELRDVRLDTSCPVTDE